MHELADTVGQSDERVTTGGIGIPVLLDTRSRTASMGGVDVTAKMSQRGWMTIPAGKALTVNLATPGSGWVTCESHDTYI